MTACRLPTVSINGATGQELSTALGTVLHFTSGRVAYTVHRLGAGRGRRAGRPGADRAVSSTAPEVSGEPIEVRGLVKRYGELTAVAGVDLTVRSGDVYGYLGPNGAGKTTSLRMMLGLIRPTEGTVRLFGRDPMQTVRALEGVAGFVEAPAFYPYLNGRRNLELLAAFDGDGAAGRIDEALDTVELSAAGEGPGRRLLARHAPAARDRRLAAAQPQAAAARRAGHRPGPGRHARHAAADPAAGRPGDDRAALQPSAGRGGGAVQPGRDRALRDGSSTRARSPRSSAGPAPSTGCRRPTTSGRWRCAAPSAGSPTCATPRARSRSPSTVRRPPPSSRRR